MNVLSVFGGAFSEYYLRTILPREARLAGRLDRAGADREYRRAASLIRDAQRELRGSRQVRVTRRVLLEPLARALGWSLGEPSEIATEIGPEDAGQPLLTGDESKPSARVLAIPGESALDLPPEGLHRRFAPAHTLVRVLEREGLTWGILLNAFELRLVRRTEGFVASHIAWSLLDLISGTDQSRDAWALLWALLRGEAWQPGAVFADEVVRLGREHQAEVGSLLGLQVPRAVESLLQGALDHPDNAATVGDWPDRRELLRELYPGALRFLYRVLFVLYAESRGLLPLDMPTYRDGYALTGGNGLVRRALNPATDPRRVPEAATGFYEDSLRALFALLREGADLGPEGRIPAYGGGLFHPHPEDRIDFDSLRLGDATIASVLQFLTRVETKAGLVTLSYRELDVEQLGSLYEGLLERSVDYADEPLWRIRLDGDVVLVTESQRQDLRRRRGETGYSAPDQEDEDEDDESAETADEETEDEDDAPSTGKKKPIRILPSEEGAPNPIPPGSVVLRAGAGRKQSGSYYTSRAFVDYLVREAVDPLARGKKPEEILRLRVCDPAMGSGHFLVGACRRLAEHLLAAYRGAVETERERVEAAGREPRTHELLLDAGVHPDVARVWQTKSPSGDEADLVACRLLVAGYCIYGVDKNKLAVELARVSLWLATAASDHPLTFLDHRLVCGDSLLGLTVDQLLRPFTDKLKLLRKAPALTGETGDKQIPLGVSQTDLNARMRRAFHWLNEIQRIEAERPGDFADQQTAFQTMQQELADFIDAHRLRVGRAFFDEGHPAWAPEVFNDWLTEIHQFGTPSQELRDKAAEAIQKGKSEGVRAFCWELAFPEVYFEPDPDSDGIRRRERAGFDAVLGNPPWDKVEPKRKEFFAEYDPGIRDFQGQTLSRRIEQLAPSGSESFLRWKRYEALQGRLATLLVRGGIYEHQVVEVNGEKTGGKPDLFKFFLERDYQLIRDGGRVGVLLPAGLYALEGATGLRQMLLGNTRVIALYSFENAFEKFFPDVDSRTKFVALVFERTKVEEQSFPAAFMLRDEGFLGLPEPERLARSVTITSDLIRRTNPAYLSVIELRDESERGFVERIYRGVPPLARKLEGDGAWNIEFHRELNMTDDAWRFRRREWLLERGCTLDGSAFIARSREWYKAAGFVPGARWVVPDGTKYRIQDFEPPEDNQRRRNRATAVHCVRGYLRADRASDVAEMPVVPETRYVPLYEGRMVHQFDHAAKAYVSGEGRGAKWRDLGINEKELVPHFYVEAIPDLKLRGGFCDVTGQTNERSALATLIPEAFPAGNSVPIAHISAAGTEPHLVWIASATSLSAEFLIRQKISTHLNIFFVDTWPLPRLLTTSTEFKRLAELAARLVSITPEIQLGPPALDPRERAELRAEIDAMVAGLYNLTPAEFGYILTTFPLLDRDQPPLEGDFYVRWNKKGQPKPEPRSYVTRDAALLAYFRAREVAPPDDLADWYRREVRLDMDNENCPFRMGPIRSLEARVAAARRAGAIAYIPSQKKHWDPNGPYQPLEAATTLVE